MPGSRTVLSEIVFMALSDPPGAAKDEVPPFVVSIGINPLNNHESRALQVRPVIIRMASAAT